VGVSGSPERQRLPERRWLLIDKSALVRADRSPDETLGQLCLCPVIRLEMLHNARSADDYGRIEDELESFHDLRMDIETFRIALTAHRELGARGRHRIPIPDLLIAACAQQHQAGVLHVDRHYDTLAEVLDFEPVRLAV
jgi:predicted nucleic acid-binding protein